MHAALYRAWKGRVKGRDWYDLVWFIRKGIHLNLTLFSKMQNQNMTLDHSQFVKIAKERINTLDIPSAIADIVNFVRDPEAIRRTWSKEFFQHWIDQIKTTN